MLAAIERWDRAWQTRDAALAAQDYSDDAVWVNAFGMRRTGRAAIERTLAEVFALPFVAAGESRTIGHDVRYLSRDIALVATIVERRGQQAPDGQALGLRRTSHLRVLQRRGDRWVIVSHLISDARDQQGPRH
ncbi:MAG TPA: nuclear transport factor 2 family protein [Phycisphaerae bacterium]|nr:nuclear transport factor 2 family protein [Phycisphaerae bacterium]